MSGACQEPAGTRSSLKTVAGRRLRDLSARPAAPVLVALVVAAFVGYSALSYFVQVPRVFGDEVIYLDAADSLADGNGLHVQGATYGRGVGYPASIAPILTASQNRSDMYLWIKVLNAFAFALAAIPIYVMARRILSRASSVAVVVLALLIPSSVYVGLVMTESVAYLASSIALCCIVLAVERPTLQRQLGALATIALAYTVRPQFAVFYPVYLLAQLGAFALLRRDRRARRRALWPTAISVGAAVAVIGALAIPNGQSVLGSYGGLWRDYSVMGVARWFEYEVADLGLYLGLIPFAVLPPIVLALYRRARADSASAAACLAVFLLATFFALLTAAAFDSTPAGLGQLHDRYFFYVVPLWLVAGAAWLESGAKQSRLSVAVGVIGLLAVAAVFPADTRIVDDAAKQLHAAGTPLWVHVRDAATAHGQTGHRAIGAAALIAAGIAYLVPRRHASWLVAPLAAVFLVNSSLLWFHDIRDNDGGVFADQSSATRGWIDRSVPGGDRVTMLYVPSSRCGAKLAYAYALTEFFNDAVAHAPNLGVPSSGGLPSKTVHVRPGGRLVQRTGAPLATRWLVVPRGVKVKGRPVAEGASRRLVLWRIAGTAKVRASSNEQLASQACRASAATTARRHAAVFKSVE